MDESALLSTKLLVPAARSDAVQRARLVARLADGVRLGRSLTLISAPPGFGKTTLLAEWARSAARPAAWLALDEGDNDAGRFVRYVIASLGQAAGGTIELREDQRLAAPQQLLVHAINALALGGLELLLVLDDYHAIRDFAVHDSIAYLLAHRPPGLHIAIATREDPPLPLARLRARDQLTEVREAALRFDDGEAAAFLTRTMHLDLPAEAISSLTARTEGWITGLQLAGLALRQQSDRGRFVADFAGDDSYIVDYLMAEVLDRAPDAVCDFLRQTSILERLSAPVCDAVTGRDGSQSMLEQLEAANMFLIRLDNRREWYRYHVLFAQVLRLSLPAQERVELHRRAARWFQAGGWADLAMYHARFAAETPEAAGSGRPGQRQPLVEPLSEREIEVLRLIAEGLPNAEIGKKLYITGGTVKRHANNIYGKLGVGSRTQAIAKARALGLLE